jgi:hypothetical protein
MPQQIITVSTERSPEEVFAYLADFRSAAEWDPGVASVDLASGTAGEGDAAYDLVTDSGIELRYEVTEFIPGHRFTLIADNGRFRSVDVISVERGGEGAVATYDATLTFSGSLRFLSPLLGPFFKRIADKAGAGLERALDGKLV